MNRIQSFLFVFTALIVALGLSDRSYGQNGPTRENPALVRIDLEADATVVRGLRQADLDIAYIGRRPGEGIHVVVDAEEIELLMRNGVPFTMLHEDLSAFYQSRFTYDDRLARDLGYGSMGGFFTFSEVVAKLDEFRSDYPTLITEKRALGTTHEGRTLWAVKISDNADVDENEPEGIIDSLTHAREPQGMMSTLYFMNWMLENYGTDPLATFLIEEREMWFVPVHNPDGYVYNETIKPDGGGSWRKNRRGGYGVDPNRNWGYKWGYNNAGSSGSKSSETYRGPYAMSEPIVQDMADLIIERNPVARMSIHCYGGMWIIPWCYEEIFCPDDALLRSLSKDMAPKNYTVGTSWQLLYVVNGGTIDWDYGDQGILTFSPEMGGVGDGFWPKTERIMPIAEENLPSLQFFFAMCGSYLRMSSHAWQEETGIINGYPEAGEEISLAMVVENAGMADCGTPVTVGITCDSPDVTILTAPQVISPITARSSVDLTAQPFRFAIDSAADYASTFVIRVELEFDNAVLSHDLEFIVGEARRTVVDDMELETGQWQAGLKDDDATEGIWEWADPNGTWNGGAPAQPDDDHSPAGTHCFVTGNGPAGAGPADYDVDKGTTRLISPVFDLSGALMPRIGYSRWFYKDADSHTDDVLIVGISNDAGETWTQVEKVKEREIDEWIEHSFLVEKIIAPTDRMQLRFKARDSYGDSIVEAAIDDLWIESYSTHPVIALYGKPVIGTTSTLGLSWFEGAQFWIYLSSGAGPGVPLAGGVWYLDPPFEIFIINGSIPADKRVLMPIPMPEEPALVGLTLNLQSFAVPQGGGTPMISNMLQHTIE